MMPAASVVTEADGSFTVPAVPAGDYQVVVKAPAGSGHATTWAGDTTVRGDATVLTLTGDRSGVDVSMVQAASVTGSVEGPAGAVEGAVVRLFATGSWAPAATAVSGPDGSFAVTELAPGSYRVRIDGPDGSGLAGQWFDGDPSGWGAAVFELAGGDSVAVAVTLTP